MHAHRNWPMLHTPHEYSPPRHLLFGAGVAGSNTSAPGTDVHTYSDPACLHGKLPSGSHEGKVHVMYVSYTDDVSDDKLVGGASHVRLAAPFNENDAQFPQKMTEQATRISGMKPGAVQSMHEGLKAIHCDLQFRG
jgi:hypothetical protein